MTPNRYYCCGWALQFVTWLQRSFPATVIEHIPIFQSGPSLYFGQHFESFLEQNKATLTHNDLIVMDYSPTDAHFLKDEQRAARIFRMLSESPALPIVLMDANKPNEDYMKRYVRETAEFKIPLFNVNLLLKNAVKAGTLSKAKFAKLNSNWPHPPWSFHQLLADAFAIGLAQWAQHLACDESLWRSVTSGVCLSRPVTRDASDGCTVNPSKYNRVFSAPDLFQAAPSGLQGTLWSAEAPWKLHEDRLGKPGWIATSPNLTDQPGNLTFRFDQNIATWMERYDSLQKTKLYVDVSFMHTYKDAGLADLFVCGQYVARLDSLWETKASIAGSFVATLPLATCGIRRGRQNKKNHVFADFGEDFLTIVLRYVPPTGTPAAARLPGNKFKLLRLELCAL
ncbi:unnamed protein product [Polarella glacialis]|uniref:Uncharacterized protein n=1 Tax=Polarella glacialis TaxID=89957 RepID=A0A813FP32_POLGL|nr:unnamed protein product [Polarella glacialis]